MVSGVYRAAAGSVRFGDAELTGLQPGQIAARGVARTFQNIVLTRGSVAENLMLGRHSITRAGFVATALRLPSAGGRQAPRTGRVPGEIAEFVGLGAVFDAPVGMLPYGVRKRVELARALCMEPKLLLLDEPVAGMDAAERVRDIAHDRGHPGRTRHLASCSSSTTWDWSCELADEVTVLDFGRRIAAGTPDRCSGTRT